MTKKVFVLVGWLTLQLSSCGPGAIGDEGIRFNDPPAPSPEDPTDPSPEAPSVDDDPFPQDDATCPSAAAVVSVSNGWQNATASEPAFDTLVLELLARPEAANLDALVAVGTGDINGFSDAAILVRFAADGLMDARDGATYRKDISFSYEAGTWYSIRISADLVSQTYDVEVARCGEAPETLIAGAAFRSDAGFADRLTTWAAWSSQSAKLELSTPTWMPSGSCAPATCASLGLECGDPSDGCDGALDCGSCGSDEACASGSCVPVQPPPPPGGDGGELPGGAPETCVSDAPIGVRCVCGGAEYSEGYCCTEGYSFSACSNDALYVVPGGTGSGNGSDWANALDGLPASLERGRIYWIADGDYGSSRRTFDDPESGALGITIRKATASEHGTETGWSPSYGDGQALFGRLDFDTGRYTIDGGGPNGIKSTVTGLVTGDLVYIGADRVVLRNMELDGGTVKNGTTQVSGICSALGVRGDKVVIDSCDLHRAADDGIEAPRVTDFKLLNSKIHGLPGCGTDGSNCDGPCFNGHSDGIEMHAATNVEIIGNMIYDIRSTGAILNKDQGSGPTVNLVLRNNILYTPEVGQVAYLAALTSPRIYNNVVWGRTQGNRYGGLAFGPDVTDLEFYNNIVTNIRFSSGYNSAQHHADYNQFGVLNTTEYPGNANDQVGDPLFNGVPLSGDAADHNAADLVLSDFALSPGSPAIDQGVTAGPAWDIVGVSRPQGLAQDMGAFEVAE